MQLTPGAIALILALAAIAATLAAGIGLLLLRVGRGWSLTLQLCIVVLAPVGSIVAALVAVSSAMFLSTHDFTVALWITAVAGCVSLVVATLLGRSFLRTTRTLVRSARIVGTLPGGSTEPATHRSTELRELADELSVAHRRLAEARTELERADASRRELIAWVSHDLRTPMASVHAMAEALEDGLVDDPARYHRGIRLEIDRLASLVDDLFELSKLEAGSMRLQRTAVSLYDLISDQIAEYTPLADGSGVRITAIGDLDTTMSADPRLMPRALGNLIGNAVTFSPPDGVIEVSVRADEHIIEIGVADAGTGIPEQDLGRVFDAGWRGDEARTARPSGGAGLGLAIVRGIAEAHSGVAEATNLPVGTRFVMRFPRAIPSDPM